MEREEPRSGNGARAGVLEVRGLRKAFGPVLAVAGIDQTFGPGEYFCIVGPSGCGKTTLLRLIAGFEEPTAGEIRLDGERLDGLPPERRDVNVVFQHYALFPHMTVYDNVAFGLRMRREPAARVRERVQAMLRLVRLEAEAGRYPGQLSGGQQQRVALARALALRPRVLLLDEPLSALDRGLRLAMQEELRRVQRETGITFLHITHDQTEALSLADRLAVMRAGRLVQVGPPREVYERPATRFVAEFLGDANVLEGALVTDRPAVVEVDGGLRLAAAGAPAGARPGARVAVAIRPEAIRLLPNGAAPGGVNALRGTVRRVAFAGPLAELAVELGGATTLRLHLPPGSAAAAEGAAIGVEVPPAAVVVLADGE